MKLRPQLHPRRRFKPAHQPGSDALAATWYPGRPGSPLEGFYLRGGAGYGWAGLADVTIDEDPPVHVPLEQEHGVRTDESGLGLGFDYLSIDKDIYKSSYYFPFTLTAAWSWD